ncbi:MAG: DPP IV N-terminal domain-containing protein, partial [Deltaproteobacteria bacterium]|nr:DPP IV N-terminal domain-containing protein [Deltaproteobacteria bacterium]
MAGGKKSAMLRAMCRLVALVVALATGAIACNHSKSSSSMNWPALDDKLLAQAAATFNFRLGNPVPLAITRDGAVLFRRTPPREFASDLYELAPDGTVRTLAKVAELLGGDEHLSDAEQARRERTRTATKGIVDVDVSDDGTRVLFALGGVLHVLDRTTAALVKVDAGDAYDPHLAPDGGAIAFVRDGNLFVYTLATKALKQITEHPEGLEYGVADFAAQEELGRQRGFWWSPDSRHLVFQRSDARKVDTIYVANPRHPEKAPVQFKYPRAGTPNAIVDLGVVAATGGSPRWLTWDLAKYVYLVAVDWDKLGGLTAVVIDREQTDGAMLAFDPATGTARTLVTEHDDAWLNFDAGRPRWLEDGSGFLWMTESRGAWTVELRRPDGTLVRPLTTPELGLRDLIGVDATGAIVNASTEPTRQDVWRIPFVGGAPVRLSDGDGDAAGTAKH